MRAEKQRYRRWEGVCTELWNDFDLIGVVHHGIHDEYSSYVPQTVKLLLVGADQLKFRAHIEKCVCVNMGMTGYPSEKIDAFAKKLADLATSEA